MKQFFISSLWLILLAVSVNSQPNSDTEKSDKKPVLVVMDLKALAGISPQESTSITGFIRTAVKKTQKYQLINREDLESIAKNYKIELAICDTDACLLKIGMLSGAQKLVAGDIGVVSGKVIINVRMVDVASDSLVNEFVCSRTCAKDADVIQQTMNSIVQELCFGSVVNPYSNVDSRQPLQNTFIGKDVVLTKEIVTADGSEMVLVREGEFLMGSPKGQGEVDEHPQHKVYLDTYYIDKCEVTNKQFKKFVDATGYVTDAERTGGGYILVNTGPWYWNKEKWVPKKSANWKDPLGDKKGITDKMNHPVVQVSWNDAVAYAQWAGKRLPTEAEWEKACRAGSTSKYYFGNESLFIAYVWSSANSEYATQPVGTLKANDWWLYDMCGNVSEWCADYYDENYYSKAPYMNPKGPDEGVNRGLHGVSRVLRGGSVLNGYAGCDSAVRFKSRPMYGWCDVGFRCVKDVNK